MRLLNKKGVSMVEVIVSIALISTVLIFLMTLFISIRGTYNKSKIQSNYQILVSTITKAIGDDIENYGLNTVEYVADGRFDMVMFKYNTPRATRFTESIKKVLKIWKDDAGVYFISYAFDSDCTYANACTENITSQERTSAIVRTVPGDAELDLSKMIDLIRINDVVEVRVPLADGSGNIYDINVFGVENKSGIAYDSSDFSVQNDEYYFEYDPATGIFTSNNQKVPNSTARTKLTFNKSFANGLTINWTVDSEINDKLTIKYNGTNVVDGIGGNAKSGSYIIQTIIPGDTLTFEYAKNASGNSFSDTATVQFGYNSDYSIENGEYYFVYNPATGLYTSNNQKKDGTTATTTITYNRGYSDGMTISWTVDSESPYDKLTIKHNGVAVLADRAGASLSGTFTISNINPGDKLTFEYTKDSSTSLYSDTATVKLGYASDFSIVNGEYYFVYDETTGVYTSNNQYKDSTTAITTITFNKSYSKGVKLVWTVDSELNYDKLTIRYNGTTVVSGRSGQKQKGQVMFAFIMPGDSFTFEYAKDNSQSSYTDTATVKLDFEPDFSIEYGEDYFFDYDPSTEEYVSNNQGQPGSTAETTLTFNKDFDKITIRWTVDSEQARDKFTIKHNGAIVLSSRSGRNQADSFVINNIKTGDTLTFVYEKDNSIDEGTDTATFKIEYD